MSACGIVLRSTYFVFQLFTRHMGDVVLDSWLRRNAEFSVTLPDGEVPVPAIDAAATRTAGEDALRIAVVNRHPEKAVSLTISGADIRRYTKAAVHTLGAPSKDSYNDRDIPDTVKLGQDSYSLTQSDQTCLNIAPGGVMGRLEGRTALVVGGGSGIGHAGAFVFICGRRESKLKEASAAISPAGERLESPTGRNPLVFRRRLQQACGTSIELEATGKIAVPQADVREEK